MWGLDKVQFRLMLILILHAGTVSRDTDPYL